MASVGVWLIGVQGSLGAPVVPGARAIASRLATGAGLVTQSPALAALPLVSMRDTDPGRRDGRRAARTLRAR